MNIEKKFLQAIRDFNLIKNNDKVIVAYSTGVDSSVLAFLLKKFQNYLKIEKLALAYLNHQIRKESDQEEEFAKKFAEKLGIEIFTEKVNIPYLAKTEKKSIEQKGREERYRFFTEILQKKGFNKLATGHHITDLAETMTLWFIQGNKKGMQGFKPKENFIIRPLYYLKKEDIQKYADEKNIPFNQDITNYSLDYLRNKVRFKVIPVLKEINPSLENSLLVMSQFLSIDEDYFNKKLENINLSEDRFNISNLDKPFIYRALDLWVQNKAKCKLSYKQLYSILKNLDKKRYKLKVCNDLYLVKENTVFYIKGGKTDKNIEFEYKIKPGEEVLIKEANIIIRAFFTDKENIPNLKNEKNLVCFDIPNLSENTTFIIRNRKKGDRFKPFGSSEKKLKDVLIDLKVPLDMRNNIPLLTFQDKILWLAGYKRSAYFPINEKSQKVICFEIKEV